MPSLLVIIVHWRIIEHTCTCILCTRACHHRDSMELLQILVRYLAGNIDNCFLQTASPTIRLKMNFSVRSYSLRRRLKANFFLKNRACSIYSRKRYPPNNYYDVLDEYATYLHRFALLYNFLWYFRNCLKPGNTIFCERH